MNRIIMNRIIILLVLSIGVSSPAWSADARWRFIESDNVPWQAYASEMGKKPQLVMFFRCDPEDSPCTLMLALPLNCDKAQDKVAEIPIKLGKSDDVAHLTCLGTGPEMNTSIWGIVKVHNASRLPNSNETEPTSEGFYNWAVEFPNHSTETIPDLDAKKTITFLIGDSEYKFNLKGSHKAFQKVYEASAGRNTTD